MKNERAFLILFFMLGTWLFNACTPYKVPVGKPPPLLKKKGVDHVVEKHQTLYRISKTYGVNIKEIASLNGITNPDKIQVGQRIFIPGARKVLKVEIVIDDVVTKTDEVKKRVDEKLGFIWPLEGKIVNIFGEAPDKRHLGIDLSCPQGTPIKASKAGKVIYSSNSIKGYGNLIILRHSGEFVTLYAHNQMNLVEEEQWVESGEIIGRVGQTGDASGPHLHFEIRRNNKAVDPLLFLE